MKPLKHFKITEAYLQKALAWGRLIANDDKWKWTVDDRKAFFRIEEEIKRMRQERYQDYKHKKLCGMQSK